MKYRTLQPPSSLAKYVRYFWVLEGVANPRNPYIHRSMADGGVEMVFHFKGVFDEILHNEDTEKSFSSGLNAQSDSFRRLWFRQNLNKMMIIL